MYNSQEIAERIKLTAKSMGVPLKDVLSECGLGVNAVSQMAKGKDMLSKNMASIADYYHCSVDYLLGRTDNPALAEESNGSSIPFSPTGLLKELIDICSSMDDSQQNTVLAFAKFLSAGGVAPLTTEEMLAEAK